MTTNKQSTINDLQSQQNHLKQQYQMQLPVKGKKEDIQNKDIAKQNIEKKDK
jgi:hypothetical protein